ncbi:hypothetical protein [Heyndrickxia acidicola]|uniref:RiboL-PSP-HEPN domain-containing protein n=1 Tax=Heyndrickxia acidicola TaxID=209389 RepID=A0ABU6MBS6_9BACI|nr:hypothetical protein [Heyndrickxia acidicola]MED1201965.1 hypothetical protein [Heyndrickxia acidicola]
MRITMDIDYKSNAAKNFKTNIIGIEASHELIKSGINSHQYGENLLPAMIYYYRGMKMLAISVLERFYIEFLIESINKEEIKDKDTLTTHIRKKLNYKKTQLLSYQRLESVNKYFKLFIDKNIKFNEFQSISRIKEMLSVRHNTVHNFGYIDKKFKLENKKWIEEEPNAEVIIPTEGSFTVDLITLQTFVRYIDGYFKNTK